MKGKKLGLVGRVLLGVGALVNTTNATIDGKLNVTNSVSVCSNQDHALVHLTGATEGIDGSDSIYGSIFPPSCNVSSKIVSIVQNTELIVDARPEESLTPVKYELSLISKDGQPITINSTNELWIEMPLAVSHGYDFGTKTMTFELDNGQRYNIRTLTNNGTQVGIITLPDLNGTYDSEEVYTTVGLDFKKTADLNNDGIVNNLDYVIMAGNWGNSKAMGGIGKYLLGDITGAGGLPDGKIDSLDLIDLGGQWISPISKNTNPNSINNVLRGSYRDAFDKANQKLIEKYTRQMA